MTKLDNKKVVLERGRRKGSGSKEKGEGGIKTRGISEGHQTTL
jgi:hypothetical protein